MPPRRLAPLAIAAFLSLASAGGAGAREDPRDFVFLGGNSVAQFEQLLARPDIEGVQVVYTWRQLEPREGDYDFSAIEADLALAGKHDKKLFAQIQDRFFSPEARNLPDYVLRGAEYDGGLARQWDNPGEDKPIAQGWAAKQWNAALRHRFQALLRALGERFDGRLYGANLPESAFDPNEEEPEPGFTCDTYFEAALDNMAAMRAAFATTVVVQYVNFWPCEWDNDHRYMERAFAFAAERGIGLGGPDIVPWRRGQMKNSYPFFRQYAGRLPLVAMAVQEPTLTYTNPDTGKPFTRAEFIAFARDYLGVDVIFWTDSAPWLAAD